MIFGFPTIFCKYITNINIDVNLHSRLTSVNFQLTGKYFSYLDFIEGPTFFILNYLHFFNKLKLLFNIHQSTYYGDFINNVFISKSYC